MSLLVEHARRELELLGEFEESPTYAQSLVDMCAVFSAHGHSGASASIAIEVLYRLLRFENLTPLSDDPEEWMQHAPDMWQCIRNSEAFSNDGGMNYYLLSEGASIANPSPLHPTVHREPRQPQAPEPPTEIGS